jgi:hypothetical protein
MRLVEVSRVDPHLEEVVRYPTAAPRTVFVELAPALGGFIAGLVLMPSRWPATTAFFVGGSCLLGLLSFVLSWRKLRRQLRAAPPVPRDAVEVERHGSLWKPVVGVVVNVGFLLGSGWFWAAADDSRFAVGLVLAAALLGVGAVADFVERWSIGRWERRNGRILTSLLLGAGEVFYVERSAHAVPAA